MNLSLLGGEREQDGRGGARSKAVRCGRWPDESLAGSEGSAETSQCGTSCLAVELRLSRSCRNDSVGQRPEQGAPQACRASRDMRSSWIGSWCTTLLALSPVQASGCSCRYFLTAAGAGAEVPTGTSNGRMAGAAGLSSVKKKRKASKAVEQGAGLPSAYSLTLYWCRGHIELKAASSLCRWRGGHCQAEQT